MHWPYFLQICFFFSLFFCTKTHFTKINTYTFSHPTQQRLEILISSKFTFFQLQRSQAQRSLCARKQVSEAVFDGCGGGTSQSIDRSQIAIQFIRHARPRTALCVGCWACNADSGARAIPSLIQPMRYMCIRETMRFLVRAGTALLPNWATSWCGCYESVPIEVFLINHLMIFLRHWLPVYM